MNIDEFAQAWQQDNEFFYKDNSREFWDSTAQRFNQRFVNNTNGIHNMNTDGLMAFLQQRNILTAETNVLDIGCGPGRFTREFAKTANHVTAIDISSNMIQLAKQNTAEEYLDHADYEATDWKFLDLAARGWQKKYDLVFASMTPGISGIDTLLKMCEAGKGYCFMSGFISRKDEVADQLHRVVFGEDPKPRGKHLYYALNILFLSGYYPEIMYNYSERKQELALEEAIETYSAAFKKRNAEDNGLRDRVAGYLERVAVNGTIAEKACSKIAWIIWKV